MNSKNETTNPSIQDDYTTNHTLKREAKRIGVPLNYVWYKNKLKKPTKNGLYILNLQDEGNSGTHWISFWLEDGEVAFFDPFGFRAPLEVERFFPNYIFNDEVIQDYRAGGCGSYVLEFGQYMNENKNKSLRIRFRDFLKLFSKDPTKNRAILRKLEQR